MDRLELDALLGTAYGLDQVHRDRPAAVGHVRKALSTPEARSAATAHLAQLSAVKRARHQGGRDGCHVTVIMHGILTEALQEPPHA